jgi:hypothetical protein
MFTEKMMTYASAGAWNTPICPCFAASSGTRARTTTGSRDSCSAS